MRHYDLSFWAASLLALSLTAAALLIVGLPYLSGSQRDLLLAVSALHAVGGLAVAVALCLLPSSIEGEEDA